MDHKLIEVTRNEWSADSVRLILTPDSYAQKHLFYIQEIGFFETFQNYYVKRKNLSSFLILQTLRGKGILQYGGKEHSLTAGDVFFIDCRKEHEYHIAGEEPWVFNWIHFDGLSSAEYCDGYMRCNGSPVLRMEINELQDIFTDLLNINAVKRDTNEILSSLKITEMITLLTLYCQASHAKSAPGSDFADRVVRYIDSHIGERITLEGISKHFSMNKYSFHKLFKKCTRTPLNEYIITYRVNRAKELLRSSELSVQEVGEAVGMSNTSHFINLFKDREGITPLRYRHKWN